MENYKIIGKGVRVSWPYEIAVHWAMPESYAQGVISLSEGTGYGSAGGNFPLADMLKEIWTTNLEACNRLWLRDLASEKRRAARFSRRAKFGRITKRAALWIMARMLNQIFAETDKKARRFCSARLFHLGFSIKLGLGLGASAPCSKRIANIAS